MKRAFAIASLIVMLALLVTGCGGQAEPSATTAGGATTTIAVSSTGTTTPSATSTSQAAEGAGEITMGTTSGPYYISGTRELADGDLNYARLPGDPVEVSGHVYGGPGASTPLAGAKIEIWQADSSGEYHPNTSGDAADFGEDELALRGYVVSGGDGSYRFTSIYPGIYPGRCRHIHVEVTAPGYGSIVTQLIFPAKEGDSETPEADRIAQALPPANDLQFTSKDGVQQAVFDFHLAGD